MFILQQLKVVLLQWFSEVNNCATERCGCCAVNLIASSDVFLLVDLSFWSFYCWCFCCLCFCHCRCSSSICYLADTLRHKVNSRCPLCQSKRSSVISIVDTCLSDLRRRVRGWIRVSFEEVLSAWICPRNLFSLTCATRHTENQDSKLWQPPFLFTRHAREPLALVASINNKLSMLTEYWSN